MIIALWLASLVGLIANIKFGRRWSRLNAGEKDREVLISQMDKFLLPSLLFYPLFILTILLTLPLAWYTIVLTVLLVLFFGNDAVVYWKYAKNIKEEEAK